MKDQRRLTHLNARSSSTGLKTERRLGVLVGNRFLPALFLLVSTGRSVVGFSTRAELRLPRQHQIRTYHQVSKDDLKDVDRNGVPQPPEAGESPPFPYRNGTAFPPMAQEFNEFDYTTVNGDGAEIKEVLKIKGRQSDRNATMTGATEQQQEQQQSKSTSLITASVLAINPADMQIVTVAEPAEKNERPYNELFDIRRLPFVSMFRGSANYIANHRNTCAVYHIPGGLLDLPDPNVFRDLMNDVALTWLLGMRIVLVAGCRHQVEKRIPVDEEHRVGILRVTDQPALRIVKEEAGYVRFEVERQLARSLRLQSGNKMLEGNVVSGNFFSAQPFGVLDGVDYQYTGFVRRVEVDKIRRLFDNRDICLLTSLGVSPSGEVFNVNSESLAASVAGALGASKVIYFTEREMELRHRVHGNKIHSLRVSEAKSLLKYVDLNINKKGFATMSDNAKRNLDKNAIDLLHKIGWSIQAVELGVKRAHIISPKHGALLQELYTRDGSGTLICGDLYEGIRRATVHDVSTIHDLIVPLVKMGTLIDRPKATLEKDVDTYYVYTRDNHIVACGQLKQFENGFAEIGCLVVNNEFRSRGRGDAMLGFLERMCVMHGCTSIFVLSTQTMEWFIERGFEEVGVNRLPPSRQATYNHARKSKIYMKTIESTRDLDASELWWNR